MKLQLGKKYQKRYEKHVEEFDETLIVCINVTWVDYVNEL